MNFLRKRFASRKENPLLLKHHNTSVFNQGLAVSQSNCSTTGDHYTWQWYCHHSLGLVSTLSLNSSFCLKCSININTSMKVFHHKEADIGLNMLLAANLESFNKSLQKTAGNLQFYSNNFKNKHWDRKGRKMCLFFSCLFCSVPLLPPYSSASDSSSSWLIWK